MKTLPTWVQKEIRENTTVQWAGRRASFEVVEEISEAVFRVFIVCSIASVLYRSFEIPLWGILTAGFIVSMMLSSRAINEILSWQNEIYVVVSDEVTNGGKIYKFFGWLNRTYVTDAIGPNSPTIVSETSLFYRIWGHLTGEKMEKVRLSSQNHTYLEGRKMSPQFRRTIHAMSGYKAGQQGQSQANLALVRDIQFAFEHGGIKEQQRNEMTAEILRRAVYQ